MDATTTTEAQRVEQRNADLYRQMAAAREARGYTILGAGRGAKVHAGVSTIKGWGGNVHPRSLCQQQTPDFYHHVNTDQDAEVTCKRCLASLAKRGLI